MIFLTWLFTAVALGTFAGHLAYDVTAGVLARIERRQRLRQSLDALKALSDRVNEKQNIATPARSGRPAHAAASAADTAQSAEERKETEHRFRLFHMLARNIPLGRRFADTADLEWWCLELLRQQAEREPSDWLRERVANVVTDMWAVIDEFDEHVSVDEAAYALGHGPVLLDAWKNAWRKFQRSAGA